MEEASPSPFDEPPVTELITTELSGLPSPVSGFVTPEVQGRQKSPMPQVFGILAVIISVLGVLLNLLGLLTVDTQLELVERMDQNTTLFTAWTYLEPIIGIIVSVIFGYAGVELYNYKKKAIFIGLGAVALNVVSGLIASYVAMEFQTSLADSAEWGQLAGGTTAIFTLICNACCGMILVLPLLISPQDLE